MSITWNRKPLTFAVPQVGRTALLPQQAAIGTEARIYRLNEDVFIVSAKALGAKPGTGRSCRVVRGEQTGFWRIQRALGATYGKPISTFSPQHLRSALGLAVIDTTVEYVIERDDLERDE